MFPPRRSVFSGMALDTPGLDIIRPSSVTGFDSRPVLRSESGGAPRSSSAMASGRDHVQPLQSYPTARASGYEPTSMAQGREAVATSLFHATRW